MCGAMAKKSRDSVGWNAGPAEEPPVPAVGWDELLARAKASLDERGLERQAKREAAAERIRARNARNGVGLKFDGDGVRRALAAYYCDIVLGDRPRGYRKVFRDEGVVPSDLWLCEKVDADVMLVNEYVNAEMHRAMRADAEEAGRLAQMSQRRLVTEEGCELNQRAVEVSLKATMKDVYGDGADSSAQDSKRGISYSFPNMTLNWIVAPAELAKGVAAKPEAEAIDV